MYASGENRLRYPAGKRLGASALSERYLVSTSEYDAWLFDLDGIVAEAACTLAAWKGTFEEYLREVAKRDLRQSGANVVVRDLGPV